MITVTIDNGLEKEVIVVRSLIWHGELAQLRTILTAALVKNGNTVAVAGPLHDHYAEDCIDHLLDPNKRWVDPFVSRERTLADRDPVLEKYTGAKPPRDDIDPLEWC